MHTITFDFITHVLPFWFLVLSLFLPRISLLVLWWQGQPGPMHTVGLVPLIFAVGLPRLLILYLIYNDLGVSGWFLVHLIGLFITWGGIGGGQVSRRRRSSDA